VFTQDPGTGFTIWLTGMPLAGKHTAAKAVYERLRRIGKPAELLDGGEWEVFVGKAPGGTKEERDAITRRAGFLARMVTRAGGFAVVPQISPYREVRDQLRREIHRFLEVFVDAPVEALLARDTKGEYQKAIRGEIKNFIGITDPYEPPANPEVRVDSTRLSADDIATAVLEALVKEGALSPGDIGLARAPRKEPKAPTRKAPPSILFTAEMLKIPKVAPPAPKAESKAVPAKPDAKAAKAAPAKPGAKAAKAAPAKPDAKAAKAVPAKPDAKAAKAAAPAKPDTKQAKAAPVKAAPKALPPAKKPAKAAPAAKAKPGSVKSAPAKSAPVKSAPVKSAPVKSAPVKSAPVKSAPVKSAPVKAAAKTARAPAKGKKK
jgi:adenylylsulfate kinase